MYLFILPFKITCVMYALHGCTESQTGPGAAFQRRGDNVGCEVEVHDVEMEAEVEVEVEVGAPVSLHDEPHESSTCTYELTKST